VAVIPLLLFLFTTVDTVSAPVVAPTVMGLGRYELGEKQKSLRGKSYRTKQLANANLQACTLAGGNYYYTITILFGHGNGTADGRELRRSLPH
jgi:hypothetical protein